MWNSQKCLIIRQDSNKYTAEPPTGITTRNVINCKRDRKTINSEEGGSKWTIFALVWIVNQMLCFYLMWLAISCYFAKMHITKANSSQWFPMRETSRNFSLVSSVAIEPHERAPRHPVFHGKQTNKRDINYASLEKICPSTGELTCDLPLFFSI
jgi:hypothetical protein